MNKKIRAGEINLKTRWIIPFVLILPAIIYLPGILKGVPFPSENAPYTDLLITHYPYLLYLKNSLIDQLTLPLWSSLIYSGMPFAANPLSGLFYLPGWLAMIFPLPAGISIVLALHVVFGSTGFYLFLKKEGLGDISALVGALAFGLMPKLSAHYGAGHVTLIYAISWTPWLFYIHKVDKIGWFSGVIAAMLFLADPRWSVYAGIIWVGYIFAHRQLDLWKYELIYLGKAGLAAFLVGSPLILPLYEFSRLSTRAEMRLDDLLASSLPVEKLLGIFIPTHGGNIEWFMYAGGSVLILFTLQIVDKELRKRNIFWTVSAFVSVFVSLGAGLSSARWLTQIPIISLLRVPPRALLVLGFSLAYIAGVTVDSILKRQINDQAVMKTAFGISIFTILMAIGIVINLKENILIVYWGLCFLAAGSILMILLINQKDRRYLVILLGLFLFVDQFFISINNYSIKADWQGNDWQDLKKYLADDETLFRIYSPSYSIPQHLASQINLELADGVDPLQLRTYWEFMEIGTQVKTSGYSVSIPPFRNGNPDLDNSDSVPLPSYLSLLGVKYVISQYELENQHLELKKIISNKYIYQNTDYFGRAWIEPQGEIVSKTEPLPSDPGPADIISIQPNRIVVRGEGPGNLVLSEIYYPGWTATVDGEPTKIDIAHDLLRSVSLLEGEHLIIFNFNPLSVYVGILLSTGCWISVLLTLFRKVL